MYKKFSDAEKAGIVEQYWAGQSVAALCRQYDVCRSTLYSWLKPYRRLASSEKCQFAAFTQKDYTDLKRHAEKLENILQIPRQADCTPNAPLDDRLAAFERLQGQYSARTLCEALNISRSTYHKRIIRGDRPTVYEAHRKEIMDQILAIHENSEQRFGADKILAILRRSGISSSKKYILSLMHKMGLESISVHAKRDCRALGRKQNILRRQFHADAPNKVWAATSLASKSMTIICMSALFWTFSPERSFPIALPCATVRS